MKINVMDSIIFDSVMYWRIHFWLQRTHQVQVRREKLTSVLVIQNKQNKYAKEKFSNKTPLSSGNDSEYEGQFLIV